MKKYEEFRKIINENLQKYFENKGSYNKIIYESVSYSLNIGGKGRPLLFLLTYNLYKKLVKL